MPPADRRTDEEIRADKPDIIEFLDSYAEDDPADEVSAWVRFMVCPNCSAEYPDFHSPPGTMGTLCDNCGWSSEEEGQRHA